MAEGERKYSKTENMPFLKNGKKRKKKKKKKKWNRRCGKVTVARISGAYGPRELGPEGTLGNSGPRPPKYTGHQQQL